MGSTPRLLRPSTPQGENVRASDVHAHGKKKNDECNAGHLESRDNRSADGVHKNLKHGIMGTQEEMLKQAEEEREEPRKIKKDIYLYTAYILEQV